MTRDRDSWRHLHKTETAADICPGQRKLETVAQDRDSWRHWLRTETAGDTGSGWIHWLGTETAGDTGSGQRQLETFALNRDS